MAKETKDRRALLKGIVAGSAVVGGTKALPQEWSKPLTDSVLLPGHAATTYTEGDTRKYFSEDSDVFTDDEIKRNGDYQEYDNGTDAIDLPADYYN